MNIDEKYECDLYRGETLIVIHVYNKNLGSVVRPCGRKVIISESWLGSPRLMLAHESGTELNRKTEEIKW